MTQIVEAATPELARLYVSTYYSLQKERIQTGSRIGALVRANRVSMSQGRELHDFVDSRLLSAEKELSAKIRAFIKQEQYRGIVEWMRKQKGIGPILAAGLIAGIREISRFDNVSKLWRYCGQAVVNGKAERRSKGDKIHYNPFLKTLCWKISSSFVRVGQGGIWRQQYEYFKAEEAKVHTQKCPNCKSPKGHIDNRARRKTVKLFLSYLWEYWRRLEGLPVRPPYSHSSHTRSETQARSASHCQLETHDSNASQEARETHGRPASHPKPETQTSCASQRIDETHTKFASHELREARRSTASHRGTEAHNSSLHHPSTIQVFELN